MSADRRGSLCVEGGEEGEGDLATSLPVQGRILCPRPTSVSEEALKVCISTGRPNTLTRSQSSTTELSTWGPLE